MQLEDYFEFETFDTEFGPVERIRVKGHRISIEHVIEPYIQGVSPETLVRDYYPTLRLEEVFATLTYYLHNQAKVDEYIRHGNDIGEKYYQQHLQKEPSALTKRLRELKKQQQAANGSGNGSA
jgi:uncharacterized protein (DUF433 family)